MKTSKPLAAATLLACAGLASTQIAYAQIYGPP
jgi:hypothetical protein